MARISSEISVSQWKYVVDLLEETGMVRCRLVDTPMKQNGKLNDEEESPLADKRSIPDTCWEVDLFIPY